MTGRIFCVGLALFLFMACARLDVQTVSVMSDAELCDIFMGGMVPPRDRKKVRSEIEYRQISCRTESGRESTRAPNNLSIYDKRF